MLLILSKEDLSQYLSHPFTELDLGIDRFGLELSLEEYLSSHC